MIEKKAVENLVYRVIKGVDSAVLNNKGASCCRDIPLLGQLDSLSMVNLVIALEEAVKADFQANISLIGNDADSSEINPFKSIGTIIEYIHLQLQRKQGI